MDLTPNSVKCEREPARSRVPAYPGVHHNLHLYVRSVRILAMLPSVIEVEDRDTLIFHKIELQPWLAFPPPSPLPSPPPPRRLPLPLSALPPRLLSRPLWKRRLVCKRRSDFSSEFLFSSVILNGCGNQMATPHTSSLRTFLSAEPHFDECMFACMLQISKES